MYKSVKRHESLMTKKFFSMLFGGTLTMMVVALLLMSDQLIAGFTLGSTAVSGIMLVIPLYSFSAFFSSMISKGVPILYSKEMGKFNKDRADKVFGLGIFMSIFIGLTMFILMSIFGDAYLHSANPQVEILNVAKEYFYWMRFTMLVMPIQMFIGEMVYYDGDEFISNVANLVQGIGNIVFSIVLSYSIGVKGIGLASFLFNVISLIIFLFHFTKKNNSLRFNIFFSFDLLRDTMRYSIVDSSSYLFLSLFTAVFNFYVISHYGSKYLIIVSAITLSREFQLLFDGIGEALNPILSIYVGEHNMEGIKNIYTLAKKTSIVEGIIVTILIIVVAPFMPMVLGVTDAELVYWIVFGVRVTSVGAIFVSLLYLLSSYYLIINQIVIGLVACATRDVVFSISLILMLGGVWGIFGMFIGLLLAPILAYAFLMFCITFRYGRDDWPLLLSKVSGKNSYIFNLTTNVEEIVNTQRNIDTLLKEHNVNKLTISRVALLVEELYIFIRKVNGDKDILSECTIFIEPDGVQIISKDEGLSFDVGDENLSASSLSAYVVTSYLDQKELDNRHLTTMSLNRSSFFIKS